MTAKNSLKKTIVVALLVAAAFTATAQAAFAADPGYIIYRVQNGDSLWLIGWKFETTALGIQNLNRLQTTWISPGQVLKVPKYTVPVRELPKFVKYTVKTGDSLYIIGQKFGISLEKIKEANLLKGNILYPGQVLTVPLPPQKRYTVVGGDTPYLVGKKSGVTVEALKLINRMNSDLLWIGQVLFVPDRGAASQPPAQPPAGGAQPPVGDTQPPAGTTQPTAGTTQPPAVMTQPPAGTTQPPDPVPAPPAGGQWGEIPPGVVLYHIQAGETLSVIAKCYNTTVQAIVVTNHLHTADLVQLNQPVFIPQNSTQPVTIPYPTASRNEGFGELLDWQYASWILDSHNVAVLQDLETGKSFKARRLGGSNHADMEPLTAAGTAIMKEIYGGQWSWDRRAVLVYIDGQIIAASMAGMPHSIEDITDNDFPGHFDLHFLNSRTHYNNTIDPLHQAMVQKAAGN